MMVSWLLSLLTLMVKYTIVSMSIRRVVTIAISSFIATAAFLFLVYTY